MIHPDGLTTHIYGVITPVFSKRLAVITNFCKWHQIAHIDYKYVANYRYYSASLLEYLNDTASYLFIKIGVLHIDEEFSFVAISIIYMYNVIPIDLVGE